MVKSSPATVELARILVPRTRFLWFFKKMYTYVCCTLEVKPLKNLVQAYFLLTINLSWPYLGGGGFGAQCRFYGKNALSIVYSFKMVNFNENVKTYVSSSYISHYSLISITYFVLYLNYHIVVLSYIFSNHIG